MPSSRLFFLAQSRRCVSSGSQPGKRQLLTLAIETSCDDTCVAVLEKEAGPGGAAWLRFNGKVTSDNRQFGGVHPTTAVESHLKCLATMVREAMRALPEVEDPAVSVPVPGRSTGTGDEDGGGNRSVDVREGENVIYVDGRARRKPDFVAVTRGPGMMSNLATGLNTAKGLAVAWDVPLLAVNHMQAHALTPRLVSALEAGERQQQEEQTPTDTRETQTQTQKGESPSFPFLSLLVSGGHSLLVLSRALHDHAVLAEAPNIAVGNMLDKCARALVPASAIAQGANVMYGPLLERFAFPGSVPASSPSSPSPSPSPDTKPDYDYDYDYTPPRTRADERQVYDSGRGWFLTPPLAGAAHTGYEFSGLNGQVLKVLLERPDMGEDERRLLARQAMRVAFEHLASRLLLALEGSGARSGEAKGDPVKNTAANGNANDGDTDEDTDLRRVTTVVVAGGVASNRYLQHVLRATLDARGHAHVRLVCPPLALCTDNAAMIAWAGAEMYEAGWRSDLDVLALRKWPLDPAQGGGILGAGGWRNVEGGKAA